MKHMLITHKGRMAAASVLIVAAAAAWGFLSRRSAQASATAAPAAILVDTAAVTRADVPVYLQGLGTVQAFYTVTVTARVDGELQKVGFTEGQMVHRGDLLAQIDPRPNQAAFEQAVATKARDAAQLANARRDLDRYMVLQPQDLASKQTVDTQRATVDQLSAQLRVDQAQIDNARTQLAYTRITSPIDGRTGIRLVDPGNIVHAADTNGLVVINQIDPISVQFTLPEADFQDINRALRESSASHESLVVQAYPRNGNQLIGTGKLVLLNNQIDTATGTVALKGLFPNPTHTLWPGQYVNVRLTLGHLSKALTVPAAAVQRSQTGTYVYAVGSDGKTVRTQDIEVAQIQDGVAVISKGLDVGQRVVVDGQYKLKPGATIVEATPARAAPASSAVVAAKGDDK
jgi:multidrug efflux system membrane fusion protein